MRLTSALMMIQSFIFVSDKIPFSKQLENRFICPLKEMNSVFLTLKKKF